MRGEIVGLRQLNQQMIIVHLQLQQRVLLIHLMVSMSPQKTHLWSVSEFVKKILSDVYVLCILCSSLLSSLAILLKTLSFFMRLPLKTFSAGGICLDLSVCEQV